LTIGPRTIVYIEQDLRSHEGWITAVVKKPIRPIPEGMTLRRQLLLGSRASGLRWRELWFRQLSEDGITLSWSRQESRDAVQKDVEVAKRTGKITVTSIIAYEGRLAADPNVRGEYARLVALRDQVCAQEPGLVLGRLKRQSHVLVDLMKLQRDPINRRHAASTSSYLSYLQTRNKGKHRNAGEPAHRSAADQQSLDLSAPMTIGTHDGRVPRISLTYQVDKATHEALRLKSFNSRIPIQRLIDAAVRGWLSAEK
jgi:hypothetical protein